MTKTTNPESPAPATIHRYEPKKLAEYDRTGTVIEIEMPVGAQVLNVTASGIYALVRPDLEKVTRRFFMISTGQPIERPDMLRFICTPEQGRHLFEIVEPAN